MPSAPLPINESERLAALSRYEILDTLPEPGFDDLTALAAQICEAPIALVSLIAGTRQWFKSKVGINACETDRDQAFCAYAILKSEPLIIPDATKDARTADNALVTGEPFIRFYAGIPLINGEGFALGTLCVIDSKPRQITDRQIASLQKLAGQVTSQLELRKHSIVNERSHRLMAAQAERLNFAMTTSSLGMWDWNPQNDSLSISEISASIMGLSGAGDSPVTMAEWSKRIHPEDRPVAMRDLLESVERGSQYYCEHRVLHQDGNWRWILVQGRAVEFDTQYRVTRFSGTHQETTFKNELEMTLLDAKAKAETALREVEAFQNTLNSHSILSVADKSGRIVSVNDAFCDISGYSREELVGHDHRILSSGTHSKDFWVKVWGVLRTGQAWRGEICNRAKNGSVFWVDSIIAPFRDEAGRIEKYVTIRNDITARKAMEHELRKSASCDKLTGLCNRALFHDRLAQAVLRRKRFPSYHFAVLFLDFDRFKFINDTFGHETGDMLLQEISLRMRNIVRASDSLSTDTTQNTNARFGGDEFVILLDSLAKPQDAAVVAGRLLEAFAEPYVLGEHTIHSTASIGVFTSDVHATNAEDVLRDADTAMYEAKTSGKARYVMFDLGMRERVQKRMKLETGLRAAIDTSQFFLLYQPIVSLATGEVHSAEALIRWKHPERGLIMPGDFIPVAEDTGLIVPMGEWVLRTGCQQLMQWQAALGQQAPKSVNINVSGKQLERAEFVSSVEQILRQTGIDPTRLHLEITETTVMRDPTASRQKLNALRDMGIQIEMDDFGTGQSSLATLRDFPIDILKIDRSFVSNLKRGEKSESFLKTIYQLAQTLGMKIIAEGIENPEQLVMLREIGCEFGQGYLFSKPTAADAITTALRQPASSHGWQELQKAA